MAIPAVRFEFLNKETNKGLNDFVNVTDSEIRNITIPDVKEVTDKLESLLTPLNDLDKLIKENTDLITKDFKDNLAKLTPNLDTSTVDFKELFRDAKGAVGLMGNIAKMPDKLFDGMLGEMFPNNPTAKSLAKSVFKVCNSMGNGMGNMRPFDANVDCNGKNAKGGGGDCKPSGISSILNALTGGAYGNAFKDINGLVNAIAALVTGSYKANLCGGFGASVGLLGGNKAAINRAGVMAMSGLSAVNSIKGGMDIINNTDSFNLKLQLPNAVKSFIGLPSIDENEYGLDGMSKIKDQFGFDSRELSTAYGDVKGAASLLDTNWNKNDFGMTSICNIADTDLNNISINKGFSSLARNNLSDLPLSMNSLTSINNSIDDSFSAVCSCI